MRAVFKVSRNPSAAGGGRGSARAFLRLGLLESLLIRDLLLLGALTLLWPLKISRGQRSGLCRWPCVSSSPTAGLGPAGPRRSLRYWSAKPATKARDLGRLGS